MKWTSVVWAGLAVGCAATEEPQQARWEPAAPSAEDPEAWAPPQGQLPPPPALTLQTQGWVEGQTATVQVSGASAGERVYLLVSLNVGGVGACPPPIAPTCLDIANPVTVLSSQLASAAGTASFNVPVPEPAPVSQIAVQAAVVLAVGAELSNDALVEVHPADSDLDVDGLTAATEAALGTDPSLADTDGGGSVDGAEVVGLGTDPLDAADDVRPQYTWDADIGPMFATECASCHTTSAFGNLSVNSYSDLVGNPSDDVPGMWLVTPGDPSNSYVFHKLDGTQASVGGAGSQMPTNGLLTANQLAEVEAWILEGAAEQ